MSRSPSFAIASVVGLLVAAAPPPPAGASAQAPLPATQSGVVVSPLIETLPGEDPAAVARFVEHMRDNMYLGTYPDGSPLKPETAEERAKPILSADLAQIIFDRGRLSGNIEACGGDWKTLSFDPLMADLRARGDLTPKQLGFAALLHGAAQQQGRGMLEEECTPGFRASLSATLILSKSISQKYSKVG